MKIIENLDDIKSEDSNQSSIQMSKTSSYKFKRKNEEYEYEKDSDFEDTKKS